MAVGELLGKSMGQVAALPLAEVVHWLAYIERRAKRGPIINRFG